VLANLKHKDRLEDTPRSNSFAYSKTEKTVLTALIVQLTKIKRLSKDDPTPHTMVDACDSSTECLSGSHCFPDSKSTPESL
jgi:hypothetical protein